MSIAEQVETKILGVEDIEFEFEEFLEEHEEDLPEGLDPQYMALIPVLEDPLNKNNFLKLPKALATLPINAVLHQSWSVIFKLIGLLMILASPMLALILNAAHSVSVVNVANGVNEVNIGITLVISILLGIASSVIYLKLVFHTFNDLIHSKKAPWLVDKIKQPVQDTYQSKWDKKVFYVSLVLPLIPELFLTNITLQYNVYDTPLMILFIITLILGHLGITISFYSIIISYLFVLRNTSIYDQALSGIAERVKGYTEGQESILSKKNYEVVGILSDTPGLSIRSLGDIPIIGLGTSIFAVNALIFLIISPFTMVGPVHDFIFNEDLAIQGLSLIILAGFVLATLASFGAVIVPLVKITSVMGDFKNKALSELDPYIFDEITGVALRKDTDLTDEDLILFMIRTYIHSMKVSPVSPFRLIQIVALGIVYSLRGLPVIIGFLL